MMKFLLRREVLALLVGFNAVGTVWGLLWYQDQLSQTPWYLWPLTPDCPLTSLCFLLFLWWVREGKPWRPGWKAAISWIAVLGSMKYGVWTVVVIGEYILLPGSQPDAQDWLLVVSHAGLLAEGLLYWRQLPKFPMMYGAAMVWFLANDYADWMLGSYPRLPSPSEFDFAMWTSIGLSVVIYFWGRRILRER